MESCTAIDGQERLKKPYSMKKMYSLYLLIPALIIYVTFFVLPSIVGLFLSFFHVGSFNLEDIRFAGIYNYKNVFADEYMSVAIKNTLTFAAVTTIGKVGLGLALALFVHKKFRGVRYLKTILFLPAVLNNVAVGLVFRAMMHPTTGLINRTLESIGLDVLIQQWLTDPTLAIFSCAFVEIWKWTGFTMVILLAGLEVIDGCYYEAAEIDGVNEWKKFFCVTLPLMMPALNNALIINMVGGLKVFDIVQTLTKGGPGSSTSVFGTLVYSSFANGRYGQGCAAGIILCVGVMLIVLPTYRMLAKKEVEI